MAVLTPDTLTGSTSITVTVADDVLLKAAIIGALDSLSDPSNWLEYGSVNPDDAASYMAEIVRQLNWS